MRLVRIDVRGAATRSEQLEAAVYALGVQGLEILDAAGQVVRTIQGVIPEEGRGGRGRGGQAAGQGGGRGRGGPPTTSMAAGLNRFTWNLDHTGATTFPGMILWGGNTNGPTALPGQYQVRLTVDGQSLTQPLVIRKHPLREVSDAAFRAGPAVFAGPVFWVFLGWAFLCVLLGVGFYLAPVRHLAPGAERRRGALLALGALLPVVSRTI